MQAAITYLQNQLTVLETNAPINEREGNHEQAALERDHAHQIRSAINLIVSIVFAQKLNHAKADQAMDVY